MTGLEDIKNTWQELSARQVGQHRVSEADIGELLAKRTGHALNNIKKSIGIDTAMLFVVTLLFVLFRSYLPEQLAKTITVFFIIVWPLVIIISLLSFFYLSKINLAGSVSLKDNLEKLVGRMGLGLKISYVLAAIAPALGLFPGYWIFNRPDSFETLTLLKLTGIALLISALYYPLSRWYIRKLYGSHYKTLKNCLSELNSEE